MFDKVIDTLKEIAPSVATMLLGPGAGMAVKGLSQILTGKDEATPEEITERLQNITPDQAIAIKKLDKEAELELERIYAQDRDSARNREIELAKTPAEARDKTPARIAYTFIGGYFALAIMIIIAICTQQVTTEEMQPILQLLKDLGYAVMLILAYYFGASNQRQR